MSKTITEDDIAMFASLTGDRHPQHVDAAWAAGSRFGEQIAHGLLVLSLASGLMDWDPERVIALRRVRDAVFKAPVKIGDEVRVSSTVAGVRPVDEGTELVECRWRILNQDDRLVALAVVELLCHRTPVREPVLI